MTASHTGMTGLPAGRDLDALRALRARIGAIQWFHNWELLPGVMTNGWSQMAERLPHFHIPEDLSGQRVLDIGCADGYFTFLAEARDAEVVSIDTSPSQGYALAHEVLGSRATFHHMSVYDVSPERLGTFDVVFCFGVYYHLKHPLLALERIAGVTRGYALIESEVADLPLPPGEGAGRFFEFDDLNGDPTNWWAPNVACLLQTMRAAGFPRAELLGRYGPGETRAVARAEKGPRTAGKALSEDISLIVDTPARGAQAAGSVTVSGWTMHHLAPAGGVERVAVYLDRPDDPACELGRAEYPIARPDLAPRVNPIYGDVGFRFDWHGVDAVEPGDHRLYVLVEGQGQWGLATVPIYVGAPDARAPQPLAEPSPAAPDENETLRRAVVERDAEIERLRALVAAYERGRFMRLMRRVRSLGQRR